MTYVPARTTQEWQDAPIDFALDKYSDKEDEALIQALASTFAQEVQSQGQIVQAADNRLGEQVETYRFSPDVRLTSRRGWGTANLDLIASVIGITAGVMDIAAGTFAAALFVRRVLTRMRKQVAAHGYDKEITVASETAAALLAAAWLQEKDLPLAERLVTDADARLFANDHGPYFVVSVVSNYGNKLEAMLIVARAGGNVTRLPLPGAPELPQ